MNAADSAVPARLPIAVYVHAPFCRGRCPYCSSYSVSGAEERCAPFVRAVRAEWERLIAEQDLLRDPAARLISVYVGGGTPSVLGAEFLTEVLGILRRGITWSDPTEVSVALSPEDVVPELSAALLAAGYNRLSLGVQSFDDSVLQRLGRRHTGAKARQAAAIIRASGCKNLSIDLMYGAPEQSLESWEATVRETVQIGPEHIGCHALTRAEETLLDRLLSAGYIPSPLDENMLEQYQSAREMLLAAGYEYYEIANVARPGYRCRHHEQIWDRRPAFGLGPGAHSFDGERRWRDAPDLQVYVESLNEGHLPPREGVRLGREDAAREMIYLGMRRQEGIRWDRMQNLIGDDGINRMAKLARALAAQGFLEVDDQGLRLQPQAYFVADSVSLELIRAIVEEDVA